MMRFSVEIHIYIYCCLKAVTQSNKLIISLGFRVTTRLQKLYFINNIDGSQSKHSIMWIMSSETSSSSSASIYNKHIIRGSRMPPNSCVNWMLIPGPIAIIINMFQSMSQPCFNCIWNKIKCVHEGCSQWEPCKWVSLRKFTRWDFESLCTQIKCEMFTEQNAVFAIIYWQ